MRFLDPKEEVVKIKITPHGKYLLSMGKFNPTYYAFFDDNILYDSNYTALAGNELQNDIENRILNETPRLEGQSKFQGAEATVFIKNENLLEDIFPGIGKKITAGERSIDILEGPINQYYLQSPLGTSGYNTDKAPYYNLQMITGSILSASLAGTSGSGYFNEKGGSADLVPQIDIEIQNEIVLHQGGTRPSIKNVSQDDEMFDSFYIFEGDNGSWLEYDKKRAFIKLEEGNTEFKKENFDIEIFEIVEQLVNENDDGPGAIPKTSLKRLCFTKEDEDTGLMNIEYFFNLKFDNAIDDAYYCEAIKNNKNKVQNIFSDKTFRCPEKQEHLAHVNIYSNDKDDDQ
jgi:hypothetical protein